RHRRSGPCWFAWRSLPATRLYWWIHHTEFCVRMETWLPLYSAPTTKNGSAPDATASGSGASGGWHRSSSQAKNRKNGFRCPVTWSRIVAGERSGGPVLDGQPRHEGAFRLCALKDAAPAVDVTAGDPGVEQVTPHG